MRRHSDADRMLIFEEYVKAYAPENKRELANRKGTGREWTPLRFCSQDWLLSVAACRASRTRYEVGFFLTKDHFLFEEFAGVKAALAFFLADSFHKTGKMEIRFVGARSGEEPSLESGYLPGIPRPIREYAASVGVTLAHARKIEASEGEALYLKLARFSDELMKLLSNADGLRAAFLAHRGVWSATALEHIARHSHMPNQLLVGGPSPEDWLTFKRELLVLREAVLAERIEIALRTANSHVEQPIRSRWLPDAAVPTLAITPLSATVLSTLGGSIELQPGKELHARLIGHDATSAAFHQEEDLAAIPADRPTLLVVTKDFDWAKPPYRAAVLKCTARHVAVVKLFECLDEVDSEILARLGRCASTRRALEGPGE